ncbi:hypothetical protein [Pseudomonas sputi]|uniref:hypothetical protein n=1 Tax=Pseudomonas sputi TaxID=2892325 RepID=UPI001F1FF2AB|nr:hypothetical protein [Pseudomonas sputi]
MRISFMMMSVVLLSGCQTLKIIATPTTEAASAEQELTAVIPVTDTLLKTDGKGISLWEAWFGKKNLQDDIKTCGVSPPKTMATLGAGVLTALGGVAWDLAVDAANSKVEEIQEKSMRTWSATWFGTPAAWQQHSCYALVRYDRQNPFNAYMAVLLANRDFNSGGDKVSAMQFTPLAVVSKTSLAITKEESDGRGKVGLSIGLAVLSFKDGEKVESAADAVSVGGVSVANAGVNASPVRLDVSKGLANYSQPLQYYSVGDIYIKFSVVESGSLAGVDVKAKAEIKAVTDALGPIVKDALKNKFEAKSAD